MAKIAQPRAIATGPWGPHIAEAIQHNFERLYGSSGRLGAGGALSNALDALSPAVGDLIVCTAAGTFALLPLVTTAQRSLTNNGGTPTWALVNLATGVTGVLPLANFFNATATQRVLGRNSAGTGVYEEVTLTQLLDWIGSAARGDLLIRGAATWGRLAIGASGTRLKSDGTDPSWAALAAADVIFAATQRLLGRNTAAGGAGEEVTLSQLLDWIGSAAQGDILYRGASTWTRLGAGTVGYFLQTAGASANPVWATTTGSGSPLHAANHLDYIVDVAGAWKSDHGGAGSITGTTTGWPATAFADGPYGALGTAASTNSTASATSQTSGTNKELNFAWDFDLTFVVYTDASAVTTVRYMLGVGIANENADPVTANYIGFRFNTATPDTQWVGVTYDGTQSVTGNIAAIAANTKYFLRIRKVSGTVFFSVNGGAETSTSTHVPTNNAYASIVVRCTTLANAVRSLWLGRTWCDFGS